MTPWWQALQGPAQAVPGTPPLAYAQEYMHVSSCTRQSVCACVTLLLYRSELPAPIILQSTNSKYNQGLRVITKIQNRTSLCAHH